MRSEGQWLTLPVHMWRSNQNYNDMQEKIKSMTVVNDPAERVVKDMQDFVSLTTDEERRDAIITIARRQRQKFGKCRKMDMK